MNKTRTSNRREFLKKTATGGAALVIGFHLPGMSLVRSAEGREKDQEEETPDPFENWIRITPDDRVTLVLAKSEMGQGVITSLPMILAEELCVDWKQVSVEQARTDPQTYDLGTGGSSSVTESWLPLRQAGAAARQMLIAAAAQQWEVGPETCKAENGSVAHGHPKRYLRYGELVKRAAELPVPDLHKVTLKNPNDFVIVGHDMPRNDARAKTNGTAQFGIDSRVPGMLYAVVARCPVFGGKVASFDASKAKAVPGVRHVVQIELSGRGTSTSGGVAVVADNSWAAMEGRRALEIKWDEGPAAGESSELLHKQMVENAAKAGKVVRNDGDADAALQSAGKKYEAAYELPFAAHVCMEPMNCLVHIQADKAEAWVPTQGPQYAQAVIAGIAKLAPEKVTVHTTLMGGGFGRRYPADFVMEAASIASIAKLTGKPIMVLWTREDDMQHDFYRPASYHRLSAALDGKGNLAAWKHFQTSTSIGAMWNKDGAEKPEKTEFGTGATIPYATANLRIEYTLAKSSVTRGWWRSVEHSSSGFVIESFIDELAAAAKTDPFEYRLQSIGDSRKIPQFDADKEAPPLDTARLKDVLRLAAEKAQWGTPMEDGQGRGIAGFFCFNTYVAGVAEISIKEKELKVDRVVCAVDCGRVVNPAGVRAQVESAVIYGLTAALKDAITIDKGRVQQSNFNDYDMMRMSDAPLIEVYLVDSAEKPTGIGEPALPVVAPAVCNAIFAATGKRIRRLPIRADDLA